MNFLRVILWSIIIYLIINTARNVIRFLSSAKTAVNPNVINKKKKTKYRIESEDVIDAHFEEIDKSKSDNQKENV
ncbi:MAG: hypothetical protein WC061_04170 [Melioribacteraceae bacterium]